MPLQAWSKKVRQYDFTLPWAFQVGKDAEAAGDGEVTVTVNNVTVKTSTVSSSTEDTTTLFSAGASSITGAGQIVRGMHKFDVPSTSSDASAFNLADRVGMRLTNTGSCDITVFSVYRTFSKIYPGENFDSSDTSGTDLTADDLTDYADTFSKISTEGTAENLMYAGAQDTFAGVPIPANLTAAFSSLTSASTQADVDAILDSTAFNSYYGEQLPVATMPTIITTFNSTKSSTISLPVTLAPGDSIVVALTKDMSDYFYHPFKSPL